MYKEQQRQQHPLAIAALDFVNTDAGWKVYMTVHISQRDNLFRRVYILESFDREIAIQEILKSYIPYLFENT